MQHNFEGACKMATKNPTPTPADAEASSLNPFYCGNKSDTAYCVSCGLEALAEVFSASVSADDGPELTGKKAQGLQLLLMTMAAALSAPEAAQ
jgi:hypothetical protein